MNATSRKALPAPAPPASPSSPLAASAALRGRDHRLQQPGRSLAPPCRRRRKSASPRCCRKQVSEWDDFTGRVTAIETVDLRPRVAGYVERVAYQEGQEVKQGRPAVRDRPAPLPAAARPGPGRSRARPQPRPGWRRPRTRARRRWSRPRRSRARSSRPAAPPPPQGNAAVRAAEAAVASAQLDLQFTQVRSPIDGRAGRAAGHRRQPRPGRHHAADHAGLAGSGVRLLRSRRAELPALPGSSPATASARRRSNPVRVGLANEQGYPHDGTVDFIDNQVDAGHRHHPRPRRAAQPGPHLHARACSHACSWKAAAASRRC